MKKSQIKLIAIFILVLFAFTLAGCSQADKKQTPSPADTTAKQPLKRISIISGPSAGAWYLVAGGMAKVINKYMPGYECTIEPGAGSENIIRVANKEVVFGMVMSDCLFHAVNGTREFKEKYPQIQAMFGGHNNPMKLIARVDSGIKTFADLKGKKVALGFGGSSQALAAVAIMESLGMVADKDYKAVWITPAEITEALQDKTIDAGFNYTADPTGVMVDLTTKVPIKFIPYDVDTVVQKHPYFYKTSIPKGIYKGVDAEYFAQGANVIMVTHKDTDPELVYQITKVLMEHVDEVAEVHPAGKEWNLSNATRGIISTYHPGAEKYLKEKGALK